MAYKIQVKQADGTMLDLPIEAEPQDVSNLATKTELETVKTTADNALSIAKGAQQAKSFHNYQKLIETFNAAAQGEYKQGQSLYIGTLNVPDVWVYTAFPAGFPPQIYTYTTDEAFINALKSSAGVRVGFYSLMPLETEKVVLTDYATKAYVDEMFATNIQSLEDLIDESGVLA